MLVVATEDFELYHGLVGELRDRGVTFTTVEPGETLPECELVVTGAETELDAEVPVVCADPEDPRKAVDEALALLRGGSGRTVVGVDPGDRPGVAVLVGDTVVAAFHVPLDAVEATVREEVADVPNPLVRVGDGARLQGAKLVDALSDIPLELVDETGTTPHLGTGARGMGDVLAAVNIARIEGERVDSLDVEPTKGELQSIKNRSRERSEDGRTISERLARRVAAGELTVDEALTEHRSDTDDGSPE